MTAGNADRFQSAGRRSARRAAARAPGAGNQWRIAARIRFESSERPRNRCFLRPAARKSGARAGCRADELRQRTRPARLPAFGFHPGTAGNGPETIFVWRQSKFGAEGMEFQGMRIDHTEQIALGDRFLLRAGAEYLRAGIVSSVSSLRPHAQLSATLALAGWPR